MTDTISIIVAVYNKEDYLDECVSSLLKQTYRDIEVILVDDGSPDRCGEICDRYAKLDGRIKVIHISNGGLSHARNVGMDYASGNLIAFCDADDVVEPQMYERLHTAMIDNDADMVVCGHYRLQGDHKQEQVYSLPEGIVSREEYYKQMYEGKREMFLPFVVVWTKLIKRELLECRKPFFPEGHIYEDSWTIHYLVENAGKIYWINEPLYCWRIAEESITHSGFSIKMFDDFRAQYDRLIFLGDNYRGKDFYRNMACQCLTNGVQFYAKAINDNLADHEEIEDFYSLVCEAIVKYKNVASGGAHDRMKWWLLSRDKKLYCRLAKRFRGLKVEN